ncbi:MAG: hypothetical protein ACRD0Z_04420 [Acidimicrobiales bacterium]
MSARRSDEVWLIDKSALLRIGASPDSDAWLARIERGFVRISTHTVLESGTVLHLDRDFELIADITHQPLERLVADEPDECR